MEFLQHYCFTRYVPEHGMVQMLTAKAEGSIPPICLVTVEVIEVIWAWILPSSDSNTTWFGGHPEQGGQGYLILLQWEQVTLKKCIRLDWPCSCIFLSQLQLHQLVFQKWLL